MVEFKIAAFRKMDGAHGLLAFVDVEFFGVLTVRNFRIIRSRDTQKVFCGLPVQSYYSEEIRKINRLTVIHLPEELKSRVYESILEEYNRVGELKFQKE